MIEEKESFETRVSRLGGYLTRAYEYNKPSILFALYLSEFSRVDVEKALEKSLKEKGLEILNVDAGEHKDLPAYFSSINSSNIVFFVHNVEKGFPDSLQYLNFKREDLAEHKVKVVFWVREEELARISTEAPDFFAFRNRVVEFMEVPLAEEYRPTLVDFALETEYKSVDEIKRSIELKEKLLSELSGEDEISGYLLGSLGILYYQIGSFKKSIECGEKALKIAQDIGDRHDEGARLGNLGTAYRNLGQIEKAIEYDKKALALFQEIGDKRGEGAGLGNLGSAYSDLGQVEKAIDYYKKALAIAHENGDRHSEGIWLGKLGNAYRNLRRVEKAIEYCQKALVIAKEIGDKYNEGADLGNLGIAYNNLGQVEKAIEYYQKALAIAQEIGDKHNEGVWLNNLGYIFKNQKKYKEALACYLLAKEIRTRIKDPMLKKTESDLKNLKEELGEKEFEKLEAEVAPRAAEIVKQALEEKSSQN
ncbi:Photosystem I assembly protein Ycf3 [uncultured archaeon]|nr:Photosystem I assembly protein Ycf3 [uncultured archaeon]